MSKKSSYLLWILLIIILGTLLYYYLCCKPCYEEANKITETENTVPKSPEVKAATKEAFSIIDSNSGMAFKTNDNFNFKASNFSILNPVSNNLNNEVRKLTNYLNNNPNKHVNIYGHYTSQEKNNTAFPNLGLARANAVKNYFISNGASSKSINIQGKVNDNLIPDVKDIYFGPIRYKLNTADADDTSAKAALKALEKDIKANPLIMYFEIGNTTISLTPEQREKVANISKYVDKTDNTTIQITGHTDNTGDRSSNIQLGLNRANFVKEYFVDNGIPESKIKTSSKGPDRPIADNNTKEGQAKNRRVVVTIN